VDMKVSERRLEGSLRERREMERVGDLKVSVGFLFVGKRA
jgi:hypothetical protein